MAGLVLIYSNKERPLLSSDGKMPNERQTWVRLQAPAGNPTSLTHALNPPLLCLTHQFYHVFWLHLLQTLLGKWCHVGRHHHQRPLNPLRPHSLGQDLDGLDADLGLLWEEDEQLVCWVVLRWSVTEGLA